MVECVPLASGELIETLYSVVRGASEHTDVQDTATICDIDVLLTSG